MRGKGLKVNINHEIGVSEELVLKPSKSQNQLSSSSNRSGQVLRFRGSEIRHRSSHFDEDVICNETLSAISVDTITELRFFYERVHVCIINIVFSSFHGHHY